MVLVTGGSGFVGTHVVRWLMDSTDHHLIVLMRGNDDEEARHRLKRTWWDWPPLIAAIGSRVEVVAGDIAEPRLGLEPSRYEDLVKRVDVIVHSAADIRLDAPLEELRRTNVEGTRNVLSLGEDVHLDHGLERFSHVSTAYVAGGRAGPVPEDELSDQHGFLSNYERSKYEGEALVREAMARLPISVFRPGMVVGSSHDGHVRTFNTVYYPLRLYLSGKIRFIPVPPSHRVNLVPVDYVADAICRLTFEPQAEGGTFHVVGDHRSLPTVREMVDLTRSWASDGLHIVLPRPIYLPSILTDALADRGPMKQLAVVAPYLRDRREFRRDNMDRLLGPYPVDWRSLLPKLLTFATYVGFLHRSDRTVHEQVLFRLNGRSRPVRLFDLVGGKVTERPAGEVRREMLVAASALRAHGIGKGDRVAIVGKNSTRYLILDVALGLVGAVSVPLYYTSPPRDIEQQVADSHARLLLIGSEEVMRRVDELSLAVPMVSFCPDLPQELQGRVMPWEEFIGKAEGPGDDRSVVGFDDIATLRYTSSTTGRAKGVLFHHHHLLYMAESTASLPPWKGRNSEVFYLSFLPMNHVVEGILATYSVFYAPSPINLFFLRDFLGLQEGLRSVRPTIFFSVPRFYEKLYDRLMANSLARDVLARPDGIRHRLTAPLVRRRALRTAGLDRCTYLISGSGPMSSEILTALRALDIEVHNAYGLTEAPLVTLNMPGRNRIGTVGEPLPRTEVSVAEDGEVLVRGPQVMSGYDGSEEQPFRDGWLLTGDTGRITAEGSLVLEGRKKELIKTSYGKFVNPLKVETMLRDLPGVFEAMVVGEGRPYCTALIWTDKSAVVEEVDRQVEAVNTQLSRPEQVRAWAVLPNDLSIETGELTANMKLRRPRLAKRYAQVIEMLYGEGEAPSGVLLMGRAERET